MGVNMRLVYWARVVRVTPGRMARVLLYSRIPDAIRSARGGAVGSDIGLWRAGASARTVSLSHDSES